MLFLLRKIRKKLMYIVSLLLLSSACSDLKSRKNENPVLEQLPDPLEAGWEGEKVCEVIEENESVRILKCVFPPDVVHEKHYHAPHTGYTLVGGKFRITDSTGTRTVDVPTGYVFGNEKLSVHEVLNVGETTSEFLIIEYKQ